MRCISLSIGVLLVGASLTWAFDEPKKKPPATKSPPAKKQSEKTAEQSKKSVAEQIAAIQADLTEKQQELVSKYRAAKDDDERGKVLEAYYELPREMAPKFAAIIKKHPADPDVFAAFSGVAYSSDDAAEAADVLVKHHLDNEEELNSLCMQLGESGAAGADKILRAVAQKTKSEVTKGLALLGLGQALLARVNKGDAADAQRDAFRKEAEEALEKVVAEHADIDSGNGKTGDRASGLLFELQHLAVGVEVPDLEGEDLEGTVFKLSDYRGKVVFLDFWAHW